MAFHLFTPAVAPPRAARAALTSLEDCDSTRWNLGALWRKCHISAQRGPLNTHWRLNKSPGGVSLPASFGGAPRVWG